MISLRLLLNLASSSIGGFLSTVRIPPDLLVLAVAYFILGYLLFAVLSAAVAAVSSSVREGQGLASVFTLFAVAPFWFYSLLMLFPDSPVWVIFSIFPFSAPVLTMLRLGMTGVPGVLGSWLPHGRDDCVHCRRIASDRQAAAVLPAYVRQEAQPEGDCPQSADRVAAVSNPAPPL